MNQADVGKWSGWLEKGTWLPFPSYDSLVLSEFQYETECIHGSLIAEQKSKLNWDKNRVGEEMTEWILSSFRCGLRRRDQWTNFTTWGEAASNNPME